ncbi:MAG: hypothetical protein LAP21_23065, partial [Acidobacteriia bacterium]|nr:hypothetical protein [Terriglobia bacterium]
GGELADIVAVDLLLARELAEARVDLLAVEDEEANQDLVARRLRPARRAPDCGLPGWRATALSASSCTPASALR